VNPTRGTAALDYIHRASADLANQKRVLSHYIALARQYGCSNTDIAQAAMGTQMATPPSDASDQSPDPGPRPADA
jgi:hypothetical protein